MLVVLIEAVDLVIGVVVLDLVLHTHEHAEVVKAGIQVVLVVLHQVEGARADLMDGLPAGIEDIQRRIAGLGIGNGLHAVSRRHGDICLVGGVVGIQPVSPIRLQGIDVDRVGEPAIRQVVGLRVEDCRQQVAAGILRGSGIVVIPLVELTDADPSGLVAHVVIVVGVAELQLGMADKGQQAGVVSGAVGKLAVLVLAGAPEHAVLIQDHELVKAAEHVELLGLAVGAPELDRLIVIHIVGRAARQDRLGAGAEDRRDPLAVIQDPAPVALLVDLDLAPLLAHMILAYQIALIVGIEGAGSGLGCAAGSQVRRDHLAVVQDPAPVRSTHDDLEPLGAQIILAHQVAGAILVDGVSLTNGQLADIIGTPGIKLGNCLGTAGSQRPLIAHQGVGGVLTHRDIHHVLQVTVGVSDTLGAGVHRIGHALGVGGRSGAHVHDAQLTVGVVADGPHMAVQTQGQDVVAVGRQLDDGLLGIGGLQAEAHDTLVIGILAVDLPHRAVTVEDIVAADSGDGVGAADAHRQTAYAAIRRAGSIDVVDKVAALDQNEYVVLIAAGSLGAGDADVDGAADYLVVAVHHEHGLHGGGHRRAGGTSAQQVVAVVAPGQDTALIGDGVRGVGARGYGHDVLIRGVAVADAVEQTVKAHLTLHHSGSVTAAQLAIGVVAPGPDSTVALQSHRMLFAHGYLRRHGEVGVDDLHGQVGGGGAHAADLDLHHGLAHVLAVEVPVAHTEGGSGGIFAYVAAGGIVVLRADGADGDGAAGHLGIPVHVGVGPARPKQQVHAGLERDLQQVADIQGVALLHREGIGLDLDLLGSHQGQDPGVDVADVVTQLSVAVSTGGPHVAVVLHDQQMAVVLIAHTVVGNEDALLVLISVQTDHLGGNGVLPRRLLALGQLASVVAAHGVEVVDRLVDRGRAVLLEERSAGIVGGLDLLAGLIQLDLLDNDAGDAVAGGNAHNVAKLLVGELGRSAGGIFHRRAAHGQHLGGRLDLAQFGANGGHGAAVGIAADDLIQNAQLASLVGADAPNRTVCIHQEHVVAVNIPGAVLMLIGGAGNSDDVLVLGVGAGSSAADILLEVTKLSAVHSGAVGVHGQLPDGAAASQRVLVAHLDGTGQQGQRRRGNAVLAVHKLLTASRGIQPSTRLHKVAGVLTGEDIGQLRIALDGHLGGLGDVLVGALGGIKAQTQLAVEVGTPSPGVALVIQGQGMVLTRGDLHNIGVVTESEVHDLRSNGQQIILVAQLTHAVVAPGQDLAVLLQGYGEAVTHRDLRYGPELAERGLGRNAHHSICRKNQRNVGSDRIDSGGGIQDVVGRHIHQIVRTENRDHSHTSHLSVHYLLVAIAAGAYDVIIVIRRPGTAAGNAGAKLIRVGTQHFVAAEHGNKLALLISLSAVRTGKADHDLRLIAGDHPGVAEGLTLQHHIAVCDDEGAQSVGGVSAVVLAGPLQICLLAEVVELHDVVVPHLIGQTLALLLVDLLVHGEGVHVLTHQLLGSSAGGDRLGAGHYDIVLVILDMILYHQVRGRSDGIVVALSLGADDLPLHHVLRDLKHGDVGLVYPLGLFFDLPLLLAGAFLQAVLEVAQLAITVGAPSPDNAPLIIGGRVVAAGGHALDLDAVL